MNTTTEQLPVTQWNSESIQQQRRRVILLEPLSNSQDTKSLDRPDYKVITLFGGADCEHQAPSALRTGDFRHAVQYALHKIDYDPEYDLFVVSGRATKVALALAAIVSAHPHRSISTLLFDGRAGQYVEREV